MQSKIMVTLLSLFAEIERDLISERTKQALAAKKAQGIKLGSPKGQPPKVSSMEKRALLEMNLNMECLRVLLPGNWKCQGLRWWTL
jgi:DNA invertase Pin-like site-specific DNA recombinase